jgi:hypothetical protein
MLAAMAAAGARVRCDFAVALARPPIVLDACGPSIAYRYNCMGKRTPNKSGN